MTGDVDAKRSKTLVVTNEQMDGKHTYYMPVVGKVSAILDGHAICLLLIECQGDWQNNITSYAWCITFGNSCLNTFEIGEARERAQAYKYARVATSAHYGRDPGEGT